MPDHLDIELRAWPPGANGTSKAIHALHTPTGVAVVVVSSESSRERNQKLAVERIGLLLATLPWQLP